MNNNNGYALIAQQHRVFFQYTGWMLVGAGAVLAFTGLAFLQAARRRVR